MSTAQRVAVITGASQGIGAALVQAFRSRNYKVVATSRSIKPAAEPDIVTVQGDVADPKTAKLVFKEALDRFDRIDTLVNNAGMFMAKPFTAYSKEDYAAFMATNVTGFFHMTQRAIEIMNKQGSGHVVTVTTSLVDQPMTSVPAVLQSLTKGALNAATKSLAIHPMGRMGEVSEVVDAVMYLDSAGFVTGEILHVDGGQAAGHHTI